MLKNKNGFSLFEAVLVILLIGLSFLGFGYIFGNLDQEALKADLTVLAAKLAREKMEQKLQTKADSGYASVVLEAPKIVSSGRWQFTRQVDVNYVKPSDFSNSVTDTGYKKVEVVVSWGGGVGESVTLTSLLTDMVPSSVTGPGYPSCH
ncbi:MAG: type II secretion system protein [Pseudomonadota bacterium]